LIIFDCFNTKSNSSKNNNSKECCRRGREGIAAAAAVRGPKSSLLLLVVMVWVHLLLLLLELVEHGSGVQEAVLLLFQSSFMGFRLDQQLVETGGGPSVNELEMMVQVSIICGV
jgi:hypothetical protein